MRLARAWVVALLVGMLALVGCTEGGGDAGGVAVEEADGRAGVGDSGGAAEPGVAEDAADAPAEGDEDRQVITTGTLALVVEDPRAAADEVAAAVDEAGGRVDERSEHDSPEGQPSAWLVVRVPAQALTDVVDRLDELGETRDLSYQSTDVTRTSRDLDARIRALETSVDRLIGLMAEAESSEALIAAEAALAERQADLESLRSERAGIADQVAMSTLTVELVAAVTATIEPDGFLGGLAAGWDALVRFLGALLVAVGAVLPWVLVLAVAAAVAVPLWRRRRRRTAAVPPAAGPPQAQPADDAGSA